MATRAEPTGLARRLGHPWLHRLGLLLCVSTLVLLFFGGLVTNTGAALAVPDWPTTFAHNMFLYPWSEMVGGVFYEHSHRGEASRQWPWQVRRDVDNPGGLSVPTHLRADRQLGLV